ncbi:MAG: GNAT family N-acetyltransferase [Flavobacteriales bacterium]|nr:GNAT family N-acetyltransferase [Flavobacteriales bacterium]
MRLTGRHIVLRPPSLHDAGVLLEWENDEAVRHVSLDQGPLSLEGVQRYLRNIKDVYLDKQLRFIIELQGRPIGAIDLYDVRFDVRQASIGILIADTEMRNQGFGSEALQLVKDYASEYLDIDHFGVQVQLDNTPSRSFFEKNGFHVIGHEKDTIEMTSEIKRLA